MDRLEFTDSISSISRDKDEVLTIEPLPQSTWQKVVEISSRPPASYPPRPPLPPQSLPVIRRLPFMRSPIPPAAFFWLSVFVLLSLFFTGIFGVAVALGRGKSSPPTHGPLLDVSPRVILNGVLTLHGAGFTPRGTVGLRDNNEALFDADGQQFITVDVNGNFQSTVNVDNTWSGGQHTIVAEDAITHQVATFPIIVVGNGGVLRPAHLNLSPNVLDMGTGDQATNSFAKVKLTNGGAGGISWHATATQSWLMVSPRQGTFSHRAEMTVAVNRYNLTPGSYHAQVMISSSAGEATIQVTMQVTPLQIGNIAILQLTPALLSFSGIDDGSIPDPQVVTISNPGKRALQWQVHSDSPWLSISPGSGSVNPTGSISAAVNVNTRALLPGTYNGMLSFVNQDATDGHRVQQVMINVTITPSCSLVLAPGVVSFSSVIGEAASLSKTVDVTAGTDCTNSINWKASSSASWLSISSSHGSTPSAFRVSANTAGLAEGDYSGMVTFSFSKGTQVLPVALTVSSSTTPAIGMNLSSLVFNSVVGSSNSPTQALTITNTGGGLLQWRIATAEQWLTITPLSGQLLAKQSATINVGVKIPASVTSATYSAAIMITGTDASGNGIAGGTQTIPVTLTVSPACALAVSTNALSFSWVSGQIAPAPQVLTLSTTGACSGIVDWTANAVTDINGNWLRLSSSSGSIPFTQTSVTQAAINTTALSAGVYHGSVTFTAVDHNTRNPIGQLVSVPVTLSVQPACTLLAPSTNSQAFTAELGASPATQTFSIGVTGTCQGAVAVTATPTVSLGSNWLSVVPVDTTVTSGTATTMTVLINMAAITQAGQYTGSISLAAIDGGLTIVGSPQVVNVTLDVMAAPNISVNPSSISLSMITGLSSQPITVTNTGGGQVNWVASLRTDTPTFISLSNIPSGSLAGGQSSQFNLSVNATGLSGGTAYSTAVVISTIDTFTGQAGHPITIPVTIQIVSPALQVSTTNLSFATTAGSNPPVQSLTLTNAGGDGLSWMVSMPSASWLTLNQLVGVNAAMTKTTLTFTIDVSNLAASTTPYMAIILITPSVGAAVTINISVMVNPSQVPVLATPTPTATMNVTPTVTGVTPTVVASPAVKKSIGVHARKKNRELRDHEMFNF